MIRVDCPNCGRGIRAGKNWAGFATKCPGCGAPVRIPAIVDPMAGIPTAISAVPRRPPAGNFHVQVWVLICFFIVGLLGVLVFRTTFNAASSSTSATPQSLPITKAQFRSKITPLRYLRPRPTQADLAATFGQPFRTQTVTLPDSMGTHEESMWYWQCADGVMQVAFVNVDDGGGVALAGDTTNVAIMSINDY